MSCYEYADVLFPVQLLSWCCIQPDIVFLSIEFVLRVSDKRSTT